MKNNSHKKERKMNLRNHIRFVNRIISPSLLFLIGCSLPTEPGYDANFNVNVISNLPIVDGIATLDLDNSPAWQTIHMIDIEVTDSDGYPIEYADVDFRSNLYWQLNNVWGYIEHNELTDELVWNAYDTTFVVEGNLQDLVPTTNHSSMTDSEGLTRNALAPVMKMAGDTLVLTIDVWARGKGHIIKELKIKLEE